MLPTTLPVPVPSALSAPAAVSLSAQLTAAVPSPLAFPFSTASVCSAVLPTVSVLLVQPSPAFPQPPQGHNLTPEPVTVVVPSPPSWLAEPLQCTQATISTVPAATVSPPRLPGLPLQAFLCPLMLQPGKPGTRSPPPTGRPNIGTAPLHAGPASNFSTDYCIPVHKGRPRACIHDTNAVVILSTCLQHNDHALVTLTCHVQGSPVKVLFDPGSSHNLASASLLTALRQPLHNPRFFSVARAGHHSNEPGGTATLQLDFPLQQDGRPFAASIDVVVLPDLSPYDLLIGKPWFSEASRLLGLEVNWSSNSISISPLGSTSRMHWTSPPSPLTYVQDDDTLPMADTIMSAVQIHNCILSPAQAARLLRKPFATRQF